MARMRSLCIENVKSFYENLNKMYTLHLYPLERIWNCDKVKARLKRMVEDLFLLGLEYARFTLLCLINENGSLYLSTSMLLGQLYHLSIFSKEKNLDKIKLRDVS